MEGQYAEAKQDYDRAIQLDSSFPAAYRGRSRALYYLKDYQNALKDCNRAIQLEPQAPRAYVTRAAVRKALNDNEGARADAGKAMAQNPDMASRERALIRHILGDYTGAAKGYSLSIEADSGDARAYGNRAKIRFAQGDYAGAIVDAEKAIGLDPALEKMLAPLIAHARNRVK